MTTMADYITAVETSLVLRPDVAAMTDDELGSAYAKCAEIYRVRAGTTEADIANLHQQDILAECLRRTEARAEQSVQS